ncbi:MAG: NapC/NirT family cytochrome c [Actinomycetia bacterium]|nr:NapC/NirT family cytochrome c [Actinomycetes bacterium]
MRRLLAALRNKPFLATIGIVVVLAALAGGTIAVTDYTSRPAFCTSCHEMSPYYAAWDAGAHVGVSCVSCHVDPGFQAQVSHKVTALKEVYDHFTTEPKFPGAVTTIPDSRCLACHDEAIDPKIPGFSHEAHRGDRSCVDCHASAGHTVTSAALAEAGILDPAAAEARERLRIAVTGSGSANLPGHVAIVCSNCHGLAQTGCANCHTTEARSHPTLASVSTTAAGAASSCTNCHTTAASWAFQHPAASATCTNCHTAPRGHYAGTCSACHSPKLPFKNATFTHPGRTATCTNCHSRPSGHSAKSCVTCHRPGVSWKFYHPSSKSCASCHSAPSKHYGTRCANCHAPGRAWSSATFSHPSIPGGEHTYRSFACTSCHPNGYGSASCATCHDSTPDD